MTTRRMLAALSFALAVVYAGTKPEGAEGAWGGPARGGDARRGVGRTPLPVSDRDVARGYRLAGVVTNGAACFAPPPGARSVGTWHLTDAFEAVARAELGARFPIGGHVATGLWAHVWGRARPQLRNASNELVAVGAPMFARRGVSRLWTALTPSNTVLLTWQDFFLGRPSAPPSGLPDAPPVSAQLELFPCGDFVARSNAVARVYRRVNPDDWDGDGVPNDRDDDPRVAADEPRFGPRQTLPLGAHAGNYYWIDLVVRDVDARVAFEGDAPSNLPDPDFIAAAGATNRVALLMGKRYRVVCRESCTVVARSHPDVVVGGGADGGWEVCRPVRCEIVAASAASRSAAGGRFLRFVPEPEGGEVAWNDSYCCLEPSALPGGVPLYSCDGTCGCGGCRGGAYTCRFEGFAISFPGWPCGCSPPSPDEPHGPEGPTPGETPWQAAAEAAFSAPAVVFEDAYANAPGEPRVARRSTEVVAEFALCGGTEGGTYRLELLDGGRLVRTGGSYLPREGTLGPGETFKVRVRYEAASASGAVGDVRVRATLTERGGRAPIVSESALTAVRVEISPVVDRKEFPNRHKMGVREDFTVEYYPHEVMRTVRLAPDWRLSKGQPRSGYTCPIRAANDGVEIRVSGVSYTPKLRVVEPTGIRCTEGEDHCRDGVIAMGLEPYITPLDVSFFGIFAMEVPTTGNVPTGYFADPQFEPIWNHTEARGAGVWRHPTFDNFFFADEASFGEYCPPPLRAGVIDWAIPLAWGEDGAQSVSDRVGTMGTVYHQVFTLDAAGGLRIDKFSQWIHCTAEGVVTHSPGIRGRE